MQIFRLTLVLLSVATLGLGDNPTKPRPNADTIFASASGHDSTPHGLPAELPGRAANSVAPVTAFQAAAVSISNFKFEPKVLRVKVGTTVTWTNTDGTHTAVADGENFSSPTLSKGKSFSYKFTRRGKFPYYCSFHGSKGGGDMSGTIIVVP